VELSAYRIVQEALTNSLKHAGPATATVTIGYRAEDLELRIADTGAPSAPPAGNAMIRVLLADDEALVRGGFRAILEAQPDLEVVAEASDGTGLVQPGST
jgi:anti-sigma regulatory factor (Ser/Thr protein kinase)